MNTVSSDSGSYIFHAAIHSQSIVSGSYIRKHQASIGSLKTIAIQLKYTFLLMH